MAQNDGTMKGQMTIGPQDQDVKLAKAIDHKPYVHCFLLRESEIHLLVLKWI